MVNLAKVLWSCSHPHARVQAQDAKKAKTQSGYSALCVFAFFAPLRNQTLFCVSHYRIQVGREPGDSIRIDINIFLRLFPVTLL